MKKLSIILLAAVALGTTSCQDEKSFAEPTVNPQLPQMTTSDLKVNTTAASAINLIEANASATPVELAAIENCVNLPETYSLKFVGTLGREAAYEHAADFDITVSENRLYVAPDVLEGAYVQAMGKSAKPKEVLFRVAAYLVNKENPNAEVRFGGADYYVCEGKSTVTPLDLGIVIEDGYNLLGTINGWSVADALPMHNSGVSGYDDPIFKISVSISAAEAASGWWWKVVPQSTVAAGNWTDLPDSSFGPAVNGDHALEGNLIPRTAETDSQAGCINVPGIYTFTIDMENQSYEFVKESELLWVVGDPGWDHNTAPVVVAPAGKTAYSGFAYLTGAFKFCSQPDWNGVNYGLGAEAGTLSTAADAANLAAPAADLYFVTADTEKLTYALTPITSCGLIGDFNGWGGQEALTPMPGMNGLGWTGRFTLGEGQAFKIRFNDKWSINLGGEIDKLTVDGANITYPAGTYNVYLDLSSYPYKIQLY